MSTKDVVNSLKNSRTQINKLNVSPKPGIYAVFLKKGSKMPLKAYNDGLIYIGSSSNLATRDIDTHFTSQKSGFSTLRRSLGALLKKELRLTAIPRGTGSSKSNYQNYRFTDDGEERLSTWMKSNLEIAVFVYEDDFEALEKELIQELKPILCLKGWANPSAEFIKGLRKNCVEEASKIER